MKKIVFMLTTILLTPAFVFGLENKAQESIENDITGKYLLDYPMYKDITLGNIKTLTIIRYTEAGAYKKKVDDINEIKQIYDFLAKIKIIGKSKYSCTDNTTVYSFELNDDKKVRIEIECNRIVIDRINFDCAIEKQGEN